MQLMSLGIRWWFKHLDKERRRRGMAMERMGFGPIESAFATVLAVPGMRLRRYGSDAPAGNIALIIPALIKRHYIWDLTPESSVVQHALRDGMQVYLIEWTDPDEDGIDYGIEEYANTLIRQCVQTITSAHPDSKVFLFGHSLGGILAAIYAALWPKDSAGVILVEAPLHFDDASGAFTPFLAFGPPARKIVEMFGKVPGSLLSLTSALASPSTFQLERSVDLLASLGSSKNIKSHLLVERWTLDEAPMSGKLFEQVVEQLYRKDQFMHGTLDIAGTCIGPAQLTCPLLAIYDPGSIVIPPQSIIACHRAAASENKRLLAYHGDVGVAIAHVGALVGENAHKQLWPKVMHWIADISATRH